MSLIFFSFNTRDRAIAMEFADQLKARGHDLVIEVDQPIRLPHWRQKLMEALRSSDGVVALLTPNSVESQYVIGDTGAARLLMETEEFFFVPVLFDIREIPSFLQDLYVVKHPPQKPVAETVDEIDKTIATHMQHVRTKEKRKNRVFIGHGRSSDWMELKEFLQDRLGLAWDEFNREPTAGLTTGQRLEDMLDSSLFAFLVMTSEDTHKDGTQHARQNVVHEVGLFQGRLGFKRAIVLFEEGTEEFSNITGLTQIRFPKGRIRSAFEDIRLVLEREGLISREQGS